MFTESMKNKSIDRPKQWADDQFTFTEIICQEYNNCKFSAGFVEGHPVDTLYFQAEKNGKITTQLLLRPDEMLAIVWVMTGLLWSEIISKEDNNIKRR